MSLFGRRMGGLSVLLTLFVFCSRFSLAQTEKELKMQELSFMIGDWVGTSTTYEKGDIKDKVPAYQKISYDLDSTIIVIELHSALLQLHTIVYYDEDKRKYSYNPFSKNGVRQLPAELIDGKLVVNASESKRFIFMRTESGFREYGENLVDGVWQKYFEDNFVNTH